ncbi:sialate O-acetylesterase [Cesiribacter sp. SM1]|uniref:sialate O-acetylesterase n=1 Tax=Cesiribacter sp. SM1 TaxID=2861196 RepID=UPI001CD35D4A|nr:sialate O-acetylesterase [Cesiribacter sp. SM1]
MKCFTSYLIATILTVVAFISIPANAAVKLPRLIADGMVLQRDEPLNIWGWADPGEKVKVEFLGKTVRTKADKKGNWKIALPATAAGGPYTMKVNEKEIRDILIGDVWLSSGQSNMEFPVRRALDLYRAEIEQVNNPNIRQFRSSSRNDFENPQTDYKDGSWLPATPENIMDFSAVAYFFAAELYQQYGVPIGIISTAIGGSPAESWLSGASNRKYLDSWLAAQAKVDSTSAARKAAGVEEKPYNWTQELNKKDPGVSRWSKAGVDVSGWPQISLPGYWTEQGVDLKTGSIWFYKEFNIEDSLAAKSAILRLGRIIDSDSAFVNGTFVGTTSYQYPPRIYTIPAGLLKPGKNKLMVRVISQGGKGGFVVEKPYEVRIGSQTVDLTGDWNYHIGADVAPVYGSGGTLPWRPGGLYNGLISPAAKYPVKGVIWYQGESNTGRAGEYRELFQSLITDWRTQFEDPDMPFLYVQLANLGTPNKQPVESGWAALRDAQRRVLALPNTGMAVAYDIGEWNDIHPLNKKEVGHRLALEARRVAHGDSAVVSAGPLYNSMEVKDNSIVLTFSSVGSGLFTNALLEGFQIAGPDGRFVWADAVVLSKNKVKVWSKEVTNPTVVRYAWEDNPAGANLRNKEGLPATPFTTKEE